MITLFKRLKLLLKFKANPLAITIGSNKFLVVDNVIIDSHNNRITFNDIDELLNIAQFALEIMQRTSVIRTTIGNNLVEIRYPNSISIGAIRNLTLEQLKSITNYKQLPF